MPTLYCPECGYNLTGLNENRCPECGAGFSVQRLEEESRDADAVIGKVRKQTLLMPLLYAVLMPCWFSFPVGTADQLSPVSWVVLIVLISAVPVLAPPIWTGWMLGKRYARARRFRMPDNRPQRAERTDRFYAVLFATIHTLLMFTYFGVGILLFVLIVQLMVSP